MWFSHARGWKSTSRKRLSGGYMANETRHTTFPRTKTIEWTLISWFAVSWLNKKIWRFVTVTVMQLPLIDTCIFYARYLLMNSLFVEHFTLARRRIRQIFKLKLSSQTKNVPKLHNFRIIKFYIKIINLNGLATV